jgi:acetyltransferase-like isoleucine patch superfamily enzyme
VRYSLSMSIYHGICYVRTKLFYGPARLIRFPIDIRHGKSIRLGKRMTTGKNCRLEAAASGDGKIRLSIGENVQMNDNVHIVAAESVRIGNDVLMASKIFISDCSHGDYSGEAQSDPGTPPQERPLVSAPVVIGDRVWLGENVVVMPGVTIGEGSIIGASSVVLKDVPPRSIAVGIPASVVKRYDEGLKLWKKE